jgi:outer membrane immunogenic protein
MPLSSFNTKLFATLFFCASTVSFAEPPVYKDEPLPSCPRLQSGLYVGAQVGYDSYRVKDQFTITFPLTANSHSILNATGPVGGVFLGYGRFIKDFYYAGFEVFGNYSGADSSVISTINAIPADYHFKFRTRSSWGISILPGIRLIDTTLGYVRLGVNWADFKGAESAEFLGVNFTEAKTFVGKGFNFGFGLETLIYCHWSVRGEYTHTAYSSFNMRSGGTLNHPSDNQVMLSGLYRFFT